MKFRIVYIDARQPPEDVNYEDEDEDDVTWMSHEEEDKKIIDAVIFLLIN